MQLTNANGFPRLVRPTHWTRNLPPAIGELIAIGVVMGLAVLTWLCVVIASGSHPATTPNEARPPAHVRSIRTVAPSSAPVTEMSTAVANDSAFDGAVSATDGP